MKRKKPPKSASGAWYNWSPPAGQYQSSYLNDNLFPFQEASLFNNGHGVPWCEYPFSKFGSSVSPVMSPSGFFVFLFLFYTVWLAEHEYKKCFWHRINTTWHQNIRVLSIRFSYWIQNRALYQLLRRNYLYLSLNHSRCLNEAGRNIWATCGTERCLIHLHLNIQ